MRRSPVALLGAAVAAHVDGVQAVVEVIERIGGGGGVVGVHRHGVGVEGAGVPHNLPRGGDAVGPGDVHIRAGDGGCQALGRQTGRTGSAQRVDGARRGFVDGVDHRAATIVDPDGDLVVVVAFCPYKADGVVAADGDSGRVVARGVARGADGIGSVECGHSGAVLHDGKRTVVPAVAVAVLTHNLDLARGLRRQACWQCHGRYGHQRHQKPEKVFHCFLMFLLMLWFIVFCFLLRTCVKSANIHFSCPWPKKKCVHLLFGTCTSRSSEAHFPETYPTR